MGLLRLLRSLKKNEKEARILVLGLDNAGKTTILKALSEEDISTIMPTQGFNIKALVSTNYSKYLYQTGIYNLNLDPRRFQVKRVGHRWSKGYQTLLEKLLRKHRRSRIRRGLLRRG